MNFFEEYRDPPVSSIHWRPVVRDYMTDVSTSFNLVMLIHHNPELYGRIKSAEEKLDLMKAAPISKLLPVITEWRNLILKVQFEQRLANSQAGKQSDAARWAAGT
jgi:hypothetical protein